MTTAGVILKAIYVMACYVTAGVVLKAILIELLFGRVVSTVFPACDFVCVCSRNTIIKHKYHCQKATQCAVG
jgi:hypothetical protein